MVDLSVFFKFNYPGFIIPRFRQDRVVDNLNWKNLFLYPNLFSFKRPSSSF